MEGIISEIRMFSPNFAPKNWAYCAGQLLAINTNQALFSLLGTTFGGNGVTTFALPDFRGRVPVGTGVSSSLSQQPLGAMGGTPTVTLSSNQMPIHTHSGNLQGSVKLSVSDAAASLTTPVAGASIARPIKATGRSSTPLLGFNNAQPNVVLGNSLATSGLTIVNNVAGGSMPHDNMQPYLGMNYIICLYGIYPSRN